MIGLGLVEIQAAVDTFLAALLEEGSVSWLTYSYRVMHLPLALFGAAVGTVSLPLFSRLRAENNLEGLAASVQRSLRTISVLLIPTLLFFICFARPIIQVIYQRGEFSALDTDYTARALMFYVAGIWAAASVRTLSGAFYAFRDSRTPMFINLGSVCLNITLNLLLAFVVFSTMRFRAFAIATSTCSFFSMGLLVLLLKRRKLAGWNAWDHPAYALKITGLALASLAPVYLGYRFLLRPVIEDGLPAQWAWLSGFWGSLLILAAGFGLFVLLFWGLASLFRIKEIKSILRRR